MNADANGQSRAALRISVTPDPRSSPSNWRPAPDAQARSLRDSSELNVGERDRRRRHKRRADLLLIDADHHMRARVRHPDGGERTVADTQADEEAQRQKITRERDMGSHKHDSLPRWQRRVPKLGGLFGFIVLLQYFAGITNVDWQSPVSINLAFAGALAAMVTVPTYGFLAFTGYRFRSCKSSEDSPDLYELDGLTKAASGAAVAVIAVFAVLMYLCTRSEVLGALGSRAGETAVVIPLSVAVISAAANCLVVLVYAFDGSDEVARLDRLAAATRRPARKAHRLRRRAAQQTCR